MAKIVSAFEKGDSEYKAFTEFAWLQQLGAKLMEDQSTLLTTVNLTKLTDACHWVNIAANPYDGTIQCQFPWIKFPSAIKQTATHAVFLPIMPTIISLIQPASWFREMKPLKNDCRILI